MRHYLPLRRRISANVEASRYPISRQHEFLISFSRGFDAQIGRIGRVLKKLIPGSGAGN